MRLLETAERNEFVISCISSKRIAGRSCFVLFCYRVCLFVCLKLLCSNVCAQSGGVLPASRPLSMRCSKIIVKIVSVLCDLVLWARRLAVVASVNTVSITLLCVDKLG